MAGAPKGNSNATKAKPWTRALERIAKQNPDRIRRIAETVYMLAENGNKDAIKEIGDRLDGKPAQAITGENGGPIEFNQKVSYVVNGVAPPPRKKLLTKS